MNKLQTKVVDIFERPWNEIAAEAKSLKLEYERLLNSPSRKEREKSIGFKDELVKGNIRFYYTTNTNAQGGRSNGGGRGWYVSGPVSPGCFDSYLVKGD